jgi:hypothetical protein
MARPAKGKPPSLHGVEIPHQALAHHHEAGLFEREELTATLFEQHVKRMEGLDASGRAFR